MTAPLKSEVAWQDRLFEVLKTSDIRQVGYVPDAGHSRLIELVCKDPDIADVVLTTEEEGIGLAALIFAAAAIERRRKAMVEAVPGRWLAVALIALVAGSLVGLTIDNVPLESLGIGAWIRSLALAALAVVAPVACAAGLMRQVAIPPFSRVLGRSDDRPIDPLVVALGLLVVALCVVALQVALGQVFDPRYRDFPFAPLTAATISFLALSLAGHRPTGPRGVAETVAAAVLVGSAIFMVLNEGLENWQALWLGAALVVLGVTLLRSRAARS